MAYNNFAQQVYSDFSGGYNDTSAAISIGDKETAMSLNADYAAEVKALQTRKGCVKVNAGSYGTDVTDAHSWLIGSTFKKCVVMNNKLYDLDVATGIVKEKATLSTGKTKIYPFVTHNVLYFGDGEELYEWGAFDFSTDIESIEVKVGSIVKFTLATCTFGVKGHFYQRLTESADPIDPIAENFLNTTNWKDVTDVENFSSGVVRPMTPYDASKATVISLSVTSNATAAATLTLTLNGVEGSCECTAGQTITSIADAISKIEVFKADWTAEVINNRVIFTAKEIGAMDSLKHLMNPSTSGAEFVLAVTTEGHDDDCDLTEIKKCTIFAVHQGSQRVFAAGSPDDTALYFSEIGMGNYFLSTINKVYPAINGYGSVTAMINFSDYLLVSYENGWYSWTGTTPLTDAYWKPLNIPYGCVSARTLCLTPNSFTFLARDGIYCVSASILSDDYVLLETNRVITKLTENSVEKTINSIGNRSNAIGIFYENAYLLAYIEKHDDDGTKTKAELEDEYCRVLKYEWDTSSFTLTTGWVVNAWLNDPEELYFASRNYVIKAFDGYSDVDLNTGGKKAINFHIKTKEYHFGTPLSNKVCQLVGLIFQQHDNNDANVNIYINAGYKDYGMTYDILSEDLAESLNWARQWGKVWGFRESMVKIIELQMLSNTFQIELVNNNIDDPVTLIGIGFVYEVTDIISPTNWKDEELLK